VQFVSKNFVLNIIHKDAGLLVINKPAGLVCHPTKGDEFSSLISRARLHLNPCSRRREPAHFRVDPRIKITWGWTTTGLLF